MCVCACVWQRAVRSSTAKQRGMGAACRLTLKISQHDNNAKQDNSSGFKKFRAVLVCQRKGGTSKNGKSQNGDSCKSLRISEDARCKHKTSICFVLRCVFDERGDGMTVVTVQLGQAGNQAGHEMLKCLWDAHKDRDTDTASSTLQRFFR